ncbi:TM2 domain-containing protein [Pelistega sp. NLN82]|uniref:TM2 domain-containing protein n=1 Tax=Pelistega ratti TaxID=2652177 RepID=A0A6L9Y8U9_9BURK|nr:TM2 domain-containing protein [Pelistega ratti]NEN76258.1 TM2 domain-containing protein [Pelistega ratti]
MMQKFFIILLVFIASLMALTFGEGVLRSLGHFIQIIYFGIYEYWQDIFDYLGHFISLHPYKIILALIITAIVSFWLFHQKEQVITQPNSRRKIAILLAIFLGWLGAHRFYNNQIGLGLIYIILSILFTPFSILLSLIDALRFLFMSDETFSIKYPH